MADAAEALFKVIYEGAASATGAAKGVLDAAIEKYGEDQEVGYPDTAYFLPTIFALDGTKVTQLKQLVPILEKTIQNNVKEDFTLGGAALNGRATLFAAEIIEACSYIEGNPYKPPFTGFLPDSVLRQFGVQLVDGTIPGFAILVGKAKDNETALKMYRELQSKGLMIVLVDGITQQLIDAGADIGPEYLSVPLGNFTQIIHVINFALRAALTFGGVAGGEEEKHLEYQKKRIKAFVLALGDQDPIRLAAAVGAMYLGHPTVTDLPLEVEIPDLLYAEADPMKMIATGMELRGIKVTTLDIDVPVLLGPAFEGESIRKADMHVEFGGQRTPAFEWVDMVDADHIEDERVTLVGPDIDAVEEGGQLPLSIYVKIYGRKMQKDFESILERRLHDTVNFAEGLWHSGQRDLIWVRVGKKAYAQGFRLEHLGKIIVAKLKNDFPAIVDRVEVLITTEKDKVESVREEARKVYALRDERMRGLTDESCDTFYSCKLCQSFAPNHVCIVTPERLGLCGAVNWLDAKASFEIDPHGPNTAIEKGSPTDEHKGVYPNVNEYMYSTSNQSLEEVALYSFLELPMTSCGCFEAILALFPEGNGVMITTREHSGLTPCGMSFATLAGSVGGGTQTPGFMGIGRRYITSKKFIQGDGGLGRVCWMPKELKDYLREDIIARSVEEGLGEDFIEKIADEEVGFDSDVVLEFLTKVNHPALAMDSIV